MELQIKELFSKPGITAICGNKNSGKSNLIHHIINKAKEFNVNIFSFGLKGNIDLKKFYSVDELEEIRDSFVLIDEFDTLFNLEDRKQKRQIERTLRLINHNNNILLLAGLPHNFRKFISSQIDKVFFFKTTKDDLVNGSTIKKILMKYNGCEMGSNLLNLEESETIFFDSKHYNKFNIPYIEEKDTKKQNVDIFVQKSVLKKEEIK